MSAAANTNTPAITGLILAGGEGRRMGGIDKGWAIVDGEPLVKQTLVRLRSQVKDVLISANRNLADYAALGCPVVQDEGSGFEGPLAGLLAGLKHCTTKLLVCVPCDTPGFPPDLVARLVAPILTGEAQASFAVSDVRSQPVFMACTIDFLAPLEAAFNSGERRVGQYLLSQGAMPVRFPDESTFTNFNTLP